MVVLIVVPKLLLHPLCLPTFSYVVNECCMKSLRPAFRWKWTYRSVLRATTTNNKTYSEAKRQFSDRNRAVLMNVQSPHKWWSTHKSVVFATSSSLPQLVKEGGGLCVSL